MTAVSLAAGEAPKWTDVAGFVATSLGVTVTIAAVLVALFGPRWQAKRSQPKLSLTVDPPGLGWPAPETEFVDTMGLVLHNADGRDTARDVEVFAYVVSHATPDSMYTDLVAEIEPLVFENPLGSNLARTVSSVPPGFHRRAWWVVVGEPTQISLRAFGTDVRPSVHETGAAVCIDPSTRVSVPWLQMGREYVVHLIVTGFNFDAVYYAGTFGGAIETGADYADASCDWIETPKRIAAKSWKPPVAPRLELDDIPF